MLYEILTRCVQEAPRAPEVRQLANLRIDGQIGISRVRASILAAPSLRRTTVVFY